MLQSRKVDPNHPYKSVEWGTLEQEVFIGKEKRKLLTYIPDGALPSTSGVLVLGPDGKTAEDLLQHSGWREFADQMENREKIIVFFLEPRHGRWNQQEEYGTLYGDLAYINAAFEKCAERLHYCVHESKFYLCGFEEGGCIAHMAAMNSPAVFAGVVTVNAPDVSSQFMKECQKDFCYDLNGMVDAEARQGRLKGNIPMPVWIIEDGGKPFAQNTLDYWKRANKTLVHGQQITADTVEYSRVAETEYPLNQDKAAYHIWNSFIPDVVTKNAQYLVGQIWNNFLSKHRRWMGDPGGDLRMTKDPINDLGMDYHLEEVDGWKREWYVFVPEQIKQNPTEQVPLVFALHGYSCTGEIYAGNTNWHCVAQDRGFIVIYPSALPGKLAVKSRASDPNNIPLPAWNFLHNLPNGPDEFSFFRKMLEQACAEYPIDRTRVFVTGHSHGSMMTQALALGLPELFAAASPCSGVIFEPLYDEFIALPEFFQKSNIPIPIWMFAGCEEKWVLDAQPHTDNATGRTIALWHRRNRLSGKAEDQFHDKGITHADRWHDLIYCDEQDIPWIQYTAIDYLPHATMPEMSYRIWDEFFSNWSRDHCQICYRK